MGSGRVSGGQRIMRLLPLPPPPRPTTAAACDGGGRSMASARPSMPTVLGLLGGGLRHGHCCMAVWRVVAWLQDRCWDEERCVRMRSPGRVG